MCQGSVDGLVGYTAKGVAEVEPRDEDVFLIPFAVGGNGL